MRVYDTGDWPVSDDSRLVCCTYVDVVLKCAVNVVRCLTLFFSDAVCELLVIVGDGCVGYFVSC